MSNRSLIRHFGDRFRGGFINHVSAYEKVSNFVFFLISFLCCFLLSPSCSPSFVGVVSVSLLFSAGRRREIVNQKLQENPLFRETSLPQLYPLLLGVVASGYFPFKRTLCLLFPGDLLNSWKLCQGLFFLPFS